MKKVIIWIVIVLAVVAGILFGAKYFIKPVIFGEIKTVKALNMNLKDLRMELTFEAENPNIFPVNIVDFKFDVWLNNSYIGEVQPLHDVQLKARSKGPVSIPVRAEFKGNIFDGFLLAMETFDETETEYKAEGYVDVKVLFMQRTIKIKKSGTAKMLQPDGRHQ